ncbi:MAG: DUF2079 domain-containing protein [Ruminococcaceae bacterium]|nr:DUF2079 domain-containing protein [Oscillospiraceae bacterium]
MLNVIKKLWLRLCGVCRPSRLLCRMGAAWCAFALWNLCARQGSEKLTFQTLSFAQELTFPTICLHFIFLFALFTAISWAVGPRLEADSWLLFLCSGSCVGFWLLGYTDEKSEFLFTLAISAVFSMILVYVVRVNLPLLSSIRMNRGGMWLIVLLLALSAGTVIALIGCLRYKSFLTPNFDFGLFCNMFYNMKETGLPLVTSERDGWISHFAVHISPVYYLLLPFFWLFPSPMTLQIGQAAVIMLGVVPVVLLARHFKLSRPVTVLLAALYVFFPALSAGCFYDLHENCFLTVLLLFTFLFYEKRKYVPMYVFALLVLSVKEDAAVYLLIFALFAILSEKRYLHGGILAAMAVGYFILCGYLLKHYGEGMMINRFNNLIYNEEQGLLGAVKTALVNPGFLLTQLFSTEEGSWEKLTYALQMLLPLGLLPFCNTRASRWLLLAPILVNLLTMYVYQYDIGFQYHFAISAFLIYAAIKNLPTLSLPTKRTLLSVSAACCLCIYVSTVLPVLSTQYRYWKEDKETFSQMEEMLQEVPRDGSVVCSSFLVAHLADCEEVYEIANDPNTASDYYHVEMDTDYAVFDMRRDAQREHAERYMAAGYTVISKGAYPIIVLKAPVG